MNQILLGASIPFAAGLIVYFARRCRISPTGLVVLPLCMLLSAAWAVAPDIPRLLGMQALYNRLAHDPRCDIFLWHYTIDRMESDSPLFLPVLLAVACCLLTAAWREIRLAEEGR